jgi:zinc and cadmium transporter
MSGLLTEQFVWIVGAGVAMSAIALVGGLTLLLPAERLRSLLLPLVALSAGTLLGGAFFHLIPAAVDRLGNSVGVYLAVVAGFTLFFILEQFLNWHHCHESPCRHRPITYLILAADGLHNFIGGLAVGGAFLIDIRLGISAWIAAAAHEIPQELGDFAVLVHGGWRPTRALLFNVLSAVTFLFGGLTAYGTARHIDVAILLPFAAGNFLYIAAADLIPEIKGGRNARTNATHFLAFISGLALLLGVRFAFE